MCRGGGVGGGGSQLLWNSCWFFIRLKQFKRRKCRDGDGDRTAQGGGGVKKCDLEAVKIAVLLVADGVLAGMRGGKEGV